MDAQPVLVKLARVFSAHRLKVVLIGNMAAALRGAPVTTVDVDYMFRKTPRNLQKLKAAAKELGAVVLRPYYPASGLFRLQREDDGLQVDLMSVIDGASSFEGLRPRATEIHLDGQPILTASLADIIRSKLAAGRPKDRAVLDILKITLDEEQAKAEKKSKARWPGKMSAPW